MTKKIANAAVKHSLANGVDQGEYVGCTPEYAPLQPYPNAPVVYIKTKKGVPFVKKGRY